jgi:thioredoxin 2
VTAPLAQVACPKCGTGNRVARRDDPTSAKCGHCGKPLFEGAPIDVDDVAFARHLRMTKGALLVDIWAPWCGPCRAMAPHLAEAARTFNGQVVFLKMNADQCQTPAKLGVRGIPALHLFIDGRPAGQQAGLLTADMLNRWLNSILNVRGSS